MVSSNPLGRPKSELLFERFCQERGVRFERIPVVLNVECGRTPDWEIFPSEERILVEITQLEPNEDDRGVSPGPNRNSEGVGGRVGQRIRQEITDKADQLKTRSKGTLPAMLVIYNNTGVRSYTSPEHVRAAMFGFDTYHLVVPADPSGPNVLVDRKFGKGARMTTGCNTSLSALGVLEETFAGDLRLLIYHNFHAANRVDPSVLNLAGVEHYGLEQKTPGEFQNWVRTGY